jgi:hypothetical protein
MSFVPLSLAFFLLLPAAAAAFESTQSLIFQAESRSIAESALNSGNRVARLPSRLLQLEGRIDARTSLSIFDFTARPRAEGSLDWINGASERTASAYFQEAFFRMRLLDSLSLSAGRIQFGWGPSESISPSNWFVPEIQWQASPYFEQLGVYRSQANFTWGQGFSLILMGELQPLGDNWSSDSALPEVFRKRSLAKAEWSWDNADKILGLTAGRERRLPGELWRAGLYGSWTLDDAWQLYGDGAAREERPGGPWKPLTVLGARYTSEGGAEFRLEGIHNGSGLSRRDRVLQEALLGQVGEIALRELIEERGQSLPGREYLYAGFRWANPPFFPATFQTPVLWLRALHSLSDHSTSWIAGSEVGFLGSFSTTVYGALATGPGGGELRRLYRSLVGVAGKFVF